MLLDESNAAGIARVNEAGSPNLLSAANLLEASIVIESRKGEAGGRELDLLLYRAGVEVVPVDQEKPSRPKPRSPGSRGDDSGKIDIPPVLNCGDCFAYALAKSRC